MAAHNDLGRWGEQKAAEYLIAKGWYIRHRDWRYGHMDIDIVAIDEDSSTLLMVEVKTRASETWGYADEAIDLEKQRNIIKSAAAYVRSNRMEHCEVHYDTISVIGTDDSNVRIIHKEDAFDVTSVFSYKEQQRRRSNYKHRPGTWK